MYLARHHLSIDATNIDASIKTGFVMGVDNVTAKGLVSSNTTVVGPLFTQSTLPFIYTVWN